MRITESLDSSQEGNNSVTIRVLTDTSSASTSSFLSDSQMFISQTSGQETEGFTFQTISIIVFLSQPQKIYIFFFFTQAFIKELDLNCAPERTRFQNSAEEYISVPVLLIIPISQFSEVWVSVEEAFFNFPSSSGSFSQHVLISQVLKLSLKNYIVQRIPAGKYCT